MANPAITTTGTNNGLLLITDQHGLSHRVPKTALFNIVDSSNPNVHRLDLVLSSNEITLTFESAIVLNAFLTTLDTYY